MIIFCAHDLHITAKNVNSSSVIFTIYLYQQSNQICLDFLTHAVKMRIFNLTVDCLLSSTIISNTDYDRLCNMTRQLAANKYTTLNVIPFMCCSLATDQCLALL